MRLASIALVVVASAALSCKKDENSGANGKSGSTGKTAASASSTSGAASALVIEGKRVDIDVGEHGFTPSEVDVAKGERCTLVFTRTSNSTCAFEVVFPELKVTKDLPLERPVPIEVPTDEARTITFQCGMGMYKSKVVVQ